MRKQIQVSGFLAAMVLALGILAAGPRLTAQQETHSPVLLAQEQTQEAQPSQRSGQAAEAPEQPASDPPAGQAQGVQTFSGTIVKSGSKYVLQDSSTGKTYDIDHQDVVSQHAGEGVRVKGTLGSDGKTIHMQ